MILSDSEIFRLVDSGQLGIDPFTAQQQRKMGISHGLSSAGYDIRLGPTLDICGNFPTVIEPANFDPKVLRRVTAQNFHEFRIPAMGYALGYSLERIRMPRFLVADCLGKSTYARCNVIINVTPIEPEWEGHLTIEIANCSQMPVQLYPGAGIAQLRFHRLDGEVSVSYADRKGKYQGQPAEPIPARHEEEKPPC